MELYNDLTIDVYAILNTKGDSFYSKKYTLYEV